MNDGHHGHLAMTTGVTDKPHIDPVCGMKVNPKTSPREEYRGQMFYFCSEGCENEFKSSPAGYVRPPAIDMPVK